MGLLHRFFEWYRLWLQGNEGDVAAENYIVPVLKTDRIPGTSHRGQTFRTALPGWLVNELLGTLTENDYAFARKFNAVKVFDSTNNCYVRLWWPGPAVVLRTLLQIPLRTHQVRWLDSGEFDEFTLDNKGEKYIANRDRPIKGRRECCLRLIGDTFAGTRWLGLYVNTNKTAGIRDKGFEGYEMPFLPDELRNDLFRIYQWNKRYLSPIPRPIKYTEVSEGSRIYIETDFSNLPEIAPLFRDPEGANGSPVSHLRIQSLYIQLLAETEEKIKKKYGSEVSLVTKKSNGKLTWKYDLHTLRVSGITAMIEKGVPVEVVSQFVAGHATLIMTLYYNKQSPETIREILSKAYNEVTDCFELDTRFQSQENLEEFLISKGYDERAVAPDVAVEAMRKHSGLLTISTDGICPGTACASGGEEITKNIYGPVPGGRRCGLCRYWLTGPAFLLGQVAETNNLIYKIRNSGVAIKALKNELIDAEDGCDYATINSLRAQIEFREKELTLDITEWQARYKYALKSAEMMNSYRAASEDKTEDGYPLMHHGSLQKTLGVALVEGDELELLEYVTQFSEVMPASKNREAILDKHKFMSKLLRGTDVGDFLLSLSDADAFKLGNVLSDLVLRYIRAQDCRTILTGQHSIKDFPILNEQIKKISALSKQAQGVAGLIEGIQSGTK